MRATAQDKDAAALMGIDVNRTISFTFAIAGALAGTAGVIFVFYSTTIQFYTGFTLGLIAFTAAVLGGIGNLQGAVLGGAVDRVHPGLQRRPLVVRARHRLDAVDRLRDPDRDPRLSAAGPPRRADSRGRVDGPRASRSGSIAASGACWGSRGEGRQARWRQRPLIVQRAVPPLVIAGVVILIALALGVPPHPSLLALLAITYVLYLLPRHIRRFALADHRARPRARLPVPLGERAQRAERALRDPGLQDASRAWTRWS